MCGIAGSVDFSLHACLPDGLSTQMAHGLNPVNSNSAEIYEAQQICLIQHDARVISEDKRPLQSPDGNITIIYNGELYNTPELRQQLSVLGYAGDSDAELILYAYLAWGTKAFEKLNGIYAFALWEQQEERLTLCRDRLGVKPLFYTRQNHLFVFASELKSMLCHPAVQPKLDEDGLRTLLLLGPARPPYSGVLHGVFSVLPGQYLTFDKNGLQQSFYWQLTANEHPDTLEQTIAHTRWLVEDAAARQRTTDVPLCTFLSGGLDSSILSMLASRSLSMLGERLHTFSVDYPDNEKYFTKSIFQPDYDNSYIHQMTDFLHTEHHHILLTQHELFHALTPAMEARGLPGMADIDSSLLRFCQSVRAQGFTVCQSGECADELFGGYPWYHQKEMLFSDGFPWACSTDFRQSLVQDGILRDGQEFVHAHYERTCQSAPKLDTDSPLEARMREMFLLNLQWFMATLLTRNDRMSTYAGLQVRVPFCDYRIVEYAYNMPWKFKALEGREKGILRKAFAQDLPEEIVWRKKSPYPKTCSPEYTALVVKRLREKMQDPTSILPELFQNQVLEHLIERPEQLCAPWYGQLMRAPQIFAYLLQIDDWFRTYHISLM